jgi:rhamnosyltransferase
MNTNVSAVVITFYPNVSHLKKMINRLSLQVQHIIIVNNGPIFQLELADNISYKVCNLKENMGVGHATNLGLKIALELNSTYMLICDQDTMFPVDYVHNILSSKSSKFDVIVPNYYDVISKKSAKRFAIREHYNLDKISSKEPLPVTQAIASGMLIKKTVLDQGIFFNEKLFIDWVDFEWCWRLRKAGMTIAMRTDIFLEHRLGSYARVILKKSVNIRSASRHYYITRNAVYLSLYCPSLTFLARIKLFSKALLFIFGFPILARPFFNHFYATALGSLHGLIGKLGPNKNGF